jgi:hypothetical protein
MSESERRQTGRQSDWWQRHRRKLSGPRDLFRFLRRQSRPPKTHQQFPFYPPAPLNLLSYISSRLSSLARWLVGSLRTTLHKSPSAGHRRTMSSPQRRSGELNMSSAGRSSDDSLPLNLTLAWILIKLFPIRSTHDEPSVYSGTFVSGVLNVVCREVFEVGWHPNTHTRTLARSHATAPALRSRGH